MKTVYKKLFAILICAVMFPVIAPAAIAADRQPSIPSISDMIAFGNYHGGINPQVLSVQPEQMPGISCMGLNCKKYNDTTAAENWEACSLRKWLNDGFLVSDYKISKTASFGEKAVSGNVAASSPSKAQNYLNMAQSYIDSRDLYQARETLRKGAEEVGYFAMEDHVFWGPASDLEMACWLSGINSLESWDYMELLGYLSACTGRQAYIFLHGSLISLHGPLPLVNEYVVYSFDEEGRIIELSVHRATNPSYAARTTICLGNGRFISDCMLCVNADLMLKVDDDNDIFSKPFKIQVTYDDLGRPANGTIEGSSWITPYDTININYGDGKTQAVLSTEIPSDGMDSNGDWQISFLYDGSGRMVAVQFNTEAVSGIELTYNNGSIRAEYQWTKDYDGGSIFALFDEHGWLLSGQVDGTIQITYDKRGYFLRADISVKNEEYGFDEDEEDEEYGFDEDEEDEEYGFDEDEEDEEYYGGLYCPPVVVMSMVVEYDKAGQASTYVFDTNWGEQKTIITNLSYDEEGRVSDVRICNDYWTAYEIDAELLLVTRDKLGLPVGVYTSGLVYLGRDYDYGDNNDDDEEWDLSVRNTELVEAIYRACYNAIDSDLDNHYHVLTEVKGPDDTLVSVFFTNDDEYYDDEYDDEE